jgi:hypothetical protein
MSPDGRALSLSGVTFASVNGGTVSYSGGTSVLYTPPAGFIGEDSFTYTNQDCAGLMSTNQVVVRVQAPAQNFNLVSGPTPIGGTNYFTYQGIPGRSYALDRASSLASPIVWTALSTNVAGANGRLEMNDPNPPGGVSFYRTRWVATP